MSPDVADNAAKRQIQEAFAGLTAEGSLFCCALCGAAMTLLMRYQKGLIGLAEAEAGIGQMTDAFVARELAGDEPELRLAIMSELDAVRRIAAELLDALPNG